MLVIIGKKCNHTQPFLGRGLRSAPEWVVKLLIGYLWYQILNNLDCHLILEVEGVVPLKQWVVQAKPDRMVSREETFGFRLRWRKIKAFLLEAAFSSDSLSELPHHIPEVGPHDSTTLLSSHLLGPTSLALQPKVLLAGHIVNPSWCLLVSTCKPRLELQQNIDENIYQVLCSRGCQKLSPPYT